MMVPCFKAAAEEITRRTGFSVDEPLAALLVARHRGVKNVTGEHVEAVRAEGEPPPVAMPSMEAYEEEIAAAMKKLRGNRPPDVSREELLAQLAERRDAS